MAQDQRPEAKFGNIDHLLGTQSDSLPGASPVELLSQFQNLPKGANTGQEYLPTGFAIGGPLPQHETNINGEQLPGGPGEAQTKVIPVFTPQQLYDMGYRPAN